MPIRSGSSTCTHSGGNSSARALAKWRWIPPQTTPRGRRRPWSDHRGSRGTATRLTRAWVSPNDWLASHESRQLDWGCVIYAASKDDVERFASAEPLDHQKEDAERQARLIDALDPDGHYGIVFVEMS